jgi:DNA-binding FadR family transcriptional regulator
MRGRPDRKMANMIAIAMENDIVAGRYPVGSPLGNEAELCVQYGASRWAIREAVAIVQNDGLVTVRRGRGGGAVVNGTPARSLASAVCGFLLYANLDNEQIISARLTVDRLLYQSAAQALDREVPIRSHELLALDADSADPSTNSAEILDQIINLSGNVFLGVFALALSKLTLCRLALNGSETTSQPDAKLSARLFALRQRQLKCIISVDANGAVEAALEVAELWRSLFSAQTHGFESTRDVASSRRVAGRIADILHQGQHSQAAGIVSTMLMLDAMDAVSNSDGFLGAEAMLMERYGIARNLLREGIRILERDGFIRTETGRGGGIRAGDADSTTLVERAARIFKFLNLPTEDMKALSLELRLTAVQLALAKTSDRQALANAVRSIADHASDGGALAMFSLVAQHSDDAFIRLVEHICTRLTNDHFDRKAGIPRKDLLKRLASTISMSDIANSRRITALIHRDLLLAGNKL